MTRKRVAPKQEMLQVRIHKNIRTRAELLLEWVAGNAELSPSGSAELTDVYRIAVRLGLERLESKRRRELNENPDPPEDLVENPDSPEDLVEEEAQLNLFMERWKAGKLSQRERLEIQESFLAYHKQHHGDVMNIAPKDQPEKLIDVKLAHAVTSALLHVPEETLNAVSEWRDAETQVGRLSEKRTGRYRYTSAHPVDAVLKGVIEKVVGEES